MIASSHRQDVRSPKRNAPEQSVHEFGDRHAPSLRAPKLTDIQRTPNTQTHTHKGCTNLAIAIRLIYIQHNQPTCNAHTNTPAHTYNLQHIVLTCRLLNKEKRKNTRAVPLRVLDCMYVCMHVCTHLRMNACTDVRMCVCMHTCMYVCLYVCMYACLFVCVYVYMDVLTFLSVDGNKSETMA